MRIAQALLPAIVAGTIASSAMASAWMERPTAGLSTTNHFGSQANFTFGDAGESIAQANITAGEGVLDFITGQLASFQRPQPSGALRSLDADIFCIRILDPLAFSAVASGTSSPDLNLSLFTPAGVAVAFNDHRSDSLTSLNPRLVGSGFDAAGGAVGIPGLAVGDYFLAISRTDGSTTSRRYSRPLDSSGNLLFAGLTQLGPEASPDPIRRQDLGPITPGSTLAGWELISTTAAPFNTSYTIALTGAGYSVIPAPSAAGLLALGALARRRRR